MFRTLKVDLATCKFEGVEAVGWFLTARERGVEEETSAVWGAWDELEAGAGGERVGVYEEA